MIDEKGDINVWYWCSNLKVSKQTRNEASKNKLIIKRVINGQ